MRPAADPLRNRLIYFPGLKRRGGRNVSLSSRPVPAVPRQEKARLRRNDLVGHALPWRFYNGLSHACKSIGVRSVDGPGADERNALWSVRRRAGPVRDFLFRSRYAERQGLERLSLGRGCSGDKRPRGRRHGLKPQKIFRLRARPQPSSMTIGPSLTKGSAGRHGAKSSGASSHC